MRIVIASILLFASLSLKAQEGQAQQAPVPVPSTIRMICAERSLYAPLYLYDGYPIDSASLAIISPDDVRRINILKPKRAERRYGQAGRHGVIALESKNVSYLHILDSVTGLPVPGAVVEIAAVKDKTDVHRLAVDDNGRVRMDGLNNKGTYQLTVTNAKHSSMVVGYQPGKQPFAIIKLKPIGKTGQ